MSEAVDAHFRRLFAILFTGGEAYLALIDADDPLAIFGAARQCQYQAFLRHAGANDARDGSRSLVATHNPVTMARMRCLLDVTMVEQGVNRLVSGDPGGTETLLAAE